MQSAVKKASSLINIFLHDLDVFNNMGGILGGNGGPPEMGGSLGTMLLYSIQLALSWEFWAHSEIKGGISHNYNYPTCILLSISISLQCTLSHFFLIHFDLQ